MRYVALAALLVAVAALMIAVGGSAACIKQSFQLDVIHRAA